VAVADGLVYVGSAGQTPGARASLAAYDTATGELRWSQPLQAGRPATPSVAGGLVPSPDLNGQLQRLRWDACPDQGEWRPPAPIPPSSLC
jgi:outer membrane protein assembly factor BamB